MTPQVIENTTDSVLAPKRRRRSRGCWKQRDERAAHPRVLWDGADPYKENQIEGSSCVSCGHCVTVCPCNALMEKNMLGHAGYMTNLPPKVPTWTSARRTISVPFPERFDCIKLVIGRVTPNAPLESL